MHPFPHTYRIKTNAGKEDTLNSSLDNGLSIEVAGPVQFDGPGDRWSPEELLLASAANCLALTFRAIARSSDFEWQSLKCETEGTLDRIDKVTRFTQLKHNVSLTLAKESDRGLAEKLIHKAEHNCLISNSMNCPVVLECTIEISER